VEAVSEWIHLRYHLPLVRLDLYSAVFESDDETISLRVPREHWIDEGRPTTATFSPYVGSPS
jgi:hypothetical protein